MIVNDEFTDALDRLAEKFGDDWTAGMVGGRMTCAEADALADVLSLSGHETAAQDFLRGHANGWPDMQPSGDTDPDDEHYHLRDNSESEEDEA